MERFTAELECGVPSRQKRNYEELKELTEGVNSLDVRTGKPSFICLECVGYNKVSALFLSACPLTMLTRCE